jgi:hypothetical protein
MIKRLLYITLLIVAINNPSVAGNGLASDKPSSRLVSGKVIDKKSGEELAGAEIKIGGQTIYTDLNGNFSTSLTEQKAEALVTFISYAESKVTLDAYSGTTLIELESR